MDPIQHGCRNCIGFAMLSVYSYAIITSNQVDIFSVLAAPICANIVQQ